MQLPPTDSDLKARAAELGERLREAGASVATAESCTGGWIAKVLTDVTGSSAWFGTGIVTYSNAAKQALLGVPAALLGAHGAVSEPVVRAMAESVLARGKASLAAAVSGIAGPGGGSAEKPVGLVWFAWAGRGMETVSEARSFDGDRDAVRRMSVDHALAGLLRLAAALERPAGG